MTFPYLRNGRRSTRFRNGTLHFLGIRHPRYACGMLVSARCTCAPAYALHMPRRVLHVGPWVLPSLEEGSGCLIPWDGKTGVLASHRVRACNWVVGLFIANTQRGMALQATPEGNEREERQWGAGASRRSQAMGDEQALGLM